MICYRYEFTLKKTYPQIMANESSLEKNEPPGRFVTVIGKTYPQIMTNESNESLEKN